MLGFLLGTLLASRADAAEICAGPTTEPGIDVSKWQGTIDWAKVAASGVKYGIARAANGVTVDATFATNWSQMKAHGVLRGAYQYFQPGKDPVAQANLMVATIGALGAGDLPAVIDVEQDNGLPPEAFAAEVAAWLSIVEEKTGKKPMIYTGYYFWKDYVKGNGLGGYPLWIARYCGSCCPMIPSPWNGWKFWQHSSTGSVPGISGNVDLDHWNGTLAELQTFAGGNTCTPHCEGSLIVGADCGKGDCAAYGAFCSTAGGTQPHCASALCVASAQDVPVAHDTCYEGKRYHCDGSGGVAEKPCGAGETCLLDPSVHCEAPCVATAETCNGLDDDCDGEVDEGAKNACGVCGPLPLEACNGKDDDCDGLTDEGLTNACGGCGEAPPEACNGQDDDCDGEIDEGVTNNCGGCGDTAPEICNGKDDDCDGEVDEGLGCGGCVPLPEEICDGYDNDCDGQIDEGFVVGTQCSSGSGACVVSGVVVCDEPGSEPPTLCDAKPRDCSDSDPCTFDDCRPDIGCVHLPIVGCAGGADGSSWDNLPTWVEQEDEDVPTWDDVTRDDTVLGPGGPSVQRQESAASAGCSTTGGLPAAWLVSLLALVMLRRKVSELSSRP